jgi:hypothetical protein
VVVAAVLIHTSGCAGGGIPPTEDAARESLVKALDAWKAGRTAIEMRNESPEIIVGDSYWKHGLRLVGYEIGSGTFDGKNLRVPVTLTVAQSPRGHRKVAVKYIVGTRPVVTIFRDGE